MPLKPHYQPTRTDAADLTRDAQPGDRLYTITAEFIVTNDRSGLGTPMVRAVGTGPGPGSITVTQLLARFGALFTQPPSQN
ncbi:hypothetical protein ACFVZH_02660 [Streptomyces sp. NPDC059534]|uniref:hypothetical protein n=1 Tax=Streptomyces sp. NPDC059534 TaxID=3346859 RepID=UPI003675C64A